MKKYNVTLMLLVLLAAISCSKEEAATLKISDVSYRVQQLNDCYNGGSTIRISLEVDNNDVMIEKLINQYKDANGNGEKLEFPVQNEDIQNGQLEFEWCYFFGEDDWIEEKYKIAGMSNMGVKIESNEFTLRIERPAGAN